jgi:hypothetical protein
VQPPVSNAFLCGRLACEKCWRLGHGNLAKFQQPALKNTARALTLCAKARDLGLSSECSADDARAFKFSNRGSSSSLDDWAPMMSATALAVVADNMSVAAEWEEGRVWAVAGRVRAGGWWSEESRREGDGARARAEEGRGGKAAEAAALAEAGNWKKNRVKEERAGAGGEEGAHQPVCFATSSRGRRWPPTACLGSRGRVRAGRVSELLRFLVGCTGSIAGAVGVAAAVVLSFDRSQAPRVLRTQWG